MLLPVVIYFSIRFRDKEQHGKKVSLPSFIMAFVILMILSNTVNIPENIRFYAGETQDFLLTFAMVAIGSKIHYRDLMVKGVHALKLGSFVFAIQLALFILVLFW